MHSSTKIGIASKLRWPEKNFEDVVQKNLKLPGREQYDIVVMTSPTVDISNLGTFSMSENSERVVIESSNNMFKIAHRALTENPTLMKVVIFEHPPRFDDVHKSQLVTLANNRLNQLWDNSPFKNRIILGRHSLESSGVGAVGSKTTILAGMMVFTCWVLLGFETTQIV